MKTKLFNKIAAMTFSVGAMLGVASTAEAGIVGQPCETCGVALGAPLPEGVFFVNLTTFGARDGQNADLGTNIPITVWSTPFSFYNTRLEILAAIPVNTFTTGSNPRLAGALNRVDYYSSGLLFLFAHDFGNGFNGALSAGPRTPDNFTHAGQGIIADLRAAVSYVANGNNFTVSVNYGGNLGGKNYGTVNGFPNPGSIDDNIFLDYTFTHKFDKLELGIVGYAQTDIGGPIPYHGGSVAVGGLIGYAFEKFTIQAYATREVAIRNGGFGLGEAECLGTARAFGCNAKDTRGYVRLIVPLYVAPTAPVAPVRARY